MRTIQMPYFSFQRSSTPMPYSLGRPALNCCGGSLRTFGNMNRPVAASAAAEAAEKAPHARPIQARRVSSGDVSSASRVAVFAAAAGAGRAAAAPPGDATFVVLPARSGIGAAGGRGAGAGRAAAVAAAAAPGAGAGRAAAVVVACGVAAAFAPVGGALAVCPATAEPVFAAAAVASPVCGTIFGAGASGFVSSAMLPQNLRVSDLVSWR